MAVTVTYALNFVKNLDLPSGPATRDPDATSLANGGFAVSGTIGTNSTLDIFDAGAGIAGSSSPVTGILSAVDQISNGNIVVAAWDSSSARFDIKTPAGGHVTSANLGVNDFYPDVAALTDGTFWIAGDGLNEVHISRRNNDGSPISAFSVFPGSPSEIRASVAGLDNGGAAVTWRRTDGQHKVWYAVYDAAGGVVQAPALIATGSIATQPSMSATSDGFAIAFMDIGLGTGSYDISLVTFGFGGNVLRVSNVSNPGSGPDAPADFAPSVARLSNGYLAVAYSRTAGANADDTLVALVDPATGGVLATRNVVGGEPGSDDVAAPTVAGFKNGGIAVFHENFTDGDVDGEHLQAQRTSTGDAAANVINGDGIADVMSGLDGNDILRGFAGDDRLLGGGGKDTINGGLGRDILAGGGGGDEFVYKATADSGLTGLTSDRILDFVHLTDKINLTAIDAKTSTPGNDTFIFRGTLGFTGEGQVRVVQSGANTLVHINTTGASGAEMTIQLDKINASSLTLADFFM